MSVGWTTAICSVRVCTTNPRIFIVDPTFFFYLPARQQRESPWFLYFSLQPRRRGKKKQSQPLAQRFSHPALYEVMRIIPLTIRISHYTRAPAAWPGRPTIHVVGEWHTTTPPALTRVSGTVEMAASGDVRWTLVRDKTFSLSRAVVGGLNVQTDILS